jgi:hypothetical protein
VASVFADDHDATVPANNAALFAHLFDAWTDLHQLLLTGQTCVERTRMGTRVVGFAQARGNGGRAQDSRPGIEARSRMVTRQRTPGQVATRGISLGSSASRYRGDTG